MNTPTFDLCSLRPSFTKLPKVTSIYSFRDFLGAVSVRWGINRNNYTVDPGLYALGSPNSTSDVFVTSNYKLTFDLVRKRLKGFNAWILVLDTKGINVWCAAGKGAFGTEELIKRIHDVSLHNIVNHRRVIVPQLGAVGIAAHTVKKRTEFNVVYGPVRATDLKAYIESGYKATSEMRRVRFPAIERLKVVPVQIVQSFKYLILAIAFMMLLSGINASGLSFDRIFQASLYVIINLVAAYLAGTFLGPLLLPYIPFRSFAMKGLAIGILTAQFLHVSNMFTSSWLAISAWYMIIASVSSFLTMNFTGASTYTSLSGVLKEMRIAVPLQIGVALLGLVLYFINQFV